jgi:hypothetical protein
MTLEGDREELEGKDMEGGDSDLLQDTVSLFSWKE